MLGDMGIHIICQIITPLSRRNNFLRFSPTLSFMPFAKHGLHPLLEFIAHTNLNFFIIFFIFYLSSFVDEIGSSMAFNWDIITDNRYHSPSASHLLQYICALWIVVEHVNTSIPHSLFLFFCLLTYLIICSTLLSWYPTLSSSIGNKIPPLSGIFR